MLVEHFNDIQLAIAICRLAEGEKSENLVALYKEYYLKGGEELDDPWLLSLGQWHLEEYIRSLNAIHKHVIGKENQKLKNLFLTKRIEDKKKENITSDFEWNFDSPRLSSFDPSLITLCQKLEKSYQVN